MAVPELSDLLAFPCPPQPLQPAILVPPSQAQLHLLGWIPLVTQLRTEREGVVLLSLHRSGPVPLHRMQTRTTTTPATVSSCTWTWAMKSLSSSTAGRCTAGTPTSIALSLASSSTLTEPSPIPVSRPSPPHSSRPRPPLPSSPSWSWPHPRNHPTSFESLEVGRVLPLPEAALMGGLLILPSISNWGAEAPAGRRSRPSWGGTTRLRVLQACKSRSERGEGRRSWYSLPPGAGNLISGGKEQKQKEPHPGGRRR